MEDRVMKFAFRGVFLHFCPSACVVLYEDLMMVASNITLC
jgi:hypothetical protein